MKKSSKNNSKGFCWNGWIIPTNQSSAGHIRVLPFNPRFKFNSFSKIRKHLVKQPQWEDIREFWVSIEQAKQYEAMFPGQNSRPTYLMYQGIPLIIKKTL